ncbi:MAG: hypothetical protein ACJ8EH_12690 [Sphingomicrobium sp.]|jgi:hypothetical protein
MRRRRILLLTGVAALSACGREAELKPAPGQAMPIKPLMARTTPTVHELLTPPSYARPDRVDELVKKSQPRPRDPFDLPPPAGGNAPTLPAGTDPGTVPTNTTTVTPGE